MPWGKLFRRNFIVDNRIKFRDVPFTADLVFWYKCLCLAKKYLRVPNVTNIYRRGRPSASSRIVSSAEGVKLWLNVLTKNISAIDEFNGGLAFFKSNPDCRRDVLKFFVDKHFGMIENLFQGLAPYEVQKILYDELQTPALDSNGKNLVAAYLYTERALAK